MKRTVLVVSQHSALRGSIARLLQPLAFAVEVASGEKQARHVITSDKVLAAIIASDSLDKPGVGLARDLVRNTQRLIVLADTQSEMRRAADAVPEAHILKSNPLDQRQLLDLLADAKSGIDSSHRPTPVLHFEGRALDLAGRSLLGANGQEVILTHAEFDLLTVLVGQHGRVLSRDQLRDALGGRKADAYDRSIDMLIARLRRKIEPDPHKPRLIVTVAGVGYKFTARVRRSETGPGTVEATPIEPAKPRSAERRQLTILACQVMGLSALSARLDPEDLQSGIAAVHKVCSQIVVRRHGLICRALGDELLVCFGYPQAHEDDAQRAVQTALDLVGAVGGLEPQFPGKLSLRVGIATGLALVGGLGETVVGEGGTLVGEPLDLALGLRSEAGVGRVLVSASTHQLAGRFFKYRAPAIRSGQDMRAWEVLGKAQTLDRFEALRQSKPAAFVGRGDELNRLIRMWSKVRCGLGQAVLVSGDAGIGKSRLAAEMVRRIARDRPTVIRFFGSPHHEAAPLAPLIRELEDSCGFKSSDSQEQRLANLERLLNISSTADRIGTALVAELLSLQTGAAAAEVAQLSPQKRKEQTLTALVARIEDQAVVRPVCVVVEDAQWFDATSLEFLELLLERLPQLPLLLLLLARPDFKPAWFDHPQAAALSLARLSRNDSRTLARYVVGRGRPLAPQVIDEILVRADGVPLFVEELTKVVLETRRSKRARVSRGELRARPYIPKTLHTSLLERLDRLGPAKEVAQVAAAIGREFTHELLCGVASGGEGELRGALDQLVGSGLVLRRGTPPLATYRFKHALIRDAAHDMVVRAKRRQIHARIVSVLEEQFSEIVRAEPGLLAYHCQEAGNVSKAISYLLLASDRALSRAATTEVLTQLKQALELLSALPEDNDRWGLELRLQIALGRAEIAAHGYAAKGTQDAFHRARELCEILDDQVWPPVALLGEWVAAWWGGDQQRALGRAEQLHEWGRTQNNRAAQAVAHMATGMSLTVRSAFAEACRHFEQALAINRFVVPGLQPFIASDIDGRIQCLSFLHDCLFLLGWPARAASAARKALKEWPTALYSLALAQTALCRMYTIARNASETVRVSTSLLKLTEDQGYPFFRALCSIYRGWALANTSDVANGVKLCHAGVMLLRASGTTCGLPGYLTLLADCYLIAGDPTAGLEAIAEAIAVAEQTNGRERLSEAHRLKGKLLLLGGSSALEAEACFREATVVARRQGARLFELRATRDLAALVAAQHRSAEARAILADIFKSFTEGFDCVDLKEAKDLLDRLDERQLLKAVTD